MNNGIDFGKDGIWKILFKLAPPVMAAQLIQALYNMVDSIFVGRYSEAGLTALSIIYPIQLLMIAVAVGTGVGINTLMAHYLGMGKVKEKDETAGTATLLALVMWAVFATVSFFLMPKYAGMSTKSPEIIKEVVTYGRIVSVLSIGLFLESAWTKVLQSEGNMKLPMIAQIAGAVINIILDYLLIFGIGFFPALGIAGAAVATVTGQIAAAVIVMTKGFRKSPPLSVYKKYVKKIYYVKAADSRARGIHGAADAYGVGICGRGFLRGGRRPYPRGLGRARCLRLQIRQCACHDRIGPGRRALLRFVRALERAGSGYRGSGGGMVLG